MSIKLSRNQWLAERQKGIGGSDAPAAVGLSPWKSEYELWQEKTSPKPVSIDPTEPMIWGTKLEPVIRQRYCELTGKEVFVPARSLQHPGHDWMLANLDGVTDDDRIFEAKTSRSGDGWGESGSDQVPEYYNLQVQHYMAVTGAELADVAVLIGSSDFRILTVSSDKELQSLLIEREREFWRLVETRTPPELRTSDDVFRAYPFSQGEFASGDDSIKSACSRLQQIKDEQSALKDEQESLEATIKKAIADRDGIKVGNQVLATWKSSKPSVRFDQQAFKAKHPRVYAAFERPGRPTRRFLLKSPKKGK